MKKDICDLTSRELEAAVRGMGQPSRCAGQIFRWIYGRNVRDPGAMTDISGKFRSMLGERYRVGEPALEEELVSRDGTRKYLWLLDDGEYIESVLLKEGKRVTVCVSSQVGCRYGCVFCASGKNGFKRNLRVSEMTGQVGAVKRHSGAVPTNVVFMGMGEPLDNYTNLVKAIRIMNHPEGMHVGARKITVSTCGLVPGIRKLRDLGLQIELSVSLHAPENGLRDKIVPVNRKYPLEALIRECRKYYEATGRIITFEYVVIPGVNDSLRNADRLAAITARVRAKVNLLHNSPAADEARPRPGKARLAVFRDRLRSRGVTVTVRRPRGIDIMAACGQLAACRGESGKKKGPAP